MESGLVERSETAEPEPEPGPPGVYIDELEQLAEGLNISLINTC